MYLLRMAFPCSSSFLDFTIEFWTIPCTPVRSSTWLTIHLWFFDITETFQFQFWIVEVSWAILRSFSLRCFGLRPFNQIFLNLRLDSMFRESTVFESTIFLLTKIVWLVELIDMAPEWASGTVFIVGKVFKSSDWDWEFSWFRYHNICSFFPLATRALHTTKNQDQ